jgi:glycosyltransferase involved in cell wall biosynthesis
MAANRKIIHIMTNTPPYEEYSEDPRPQWNWDIPGGKWVGIWGYEWADQMAIEMSKVTNKYIHEVWQPDYKADRQYSYEIFPGVVHILFPARKISIRHGMKKTTYLQSIEIINSLESILNTSIIHLGPPVFIGLYKDIVEKYKGKIISSYHGIINLPINHLWKIQKDPFKKISYLIEHFRAKKYFKSISHVTYMNDTNLNFLCEYYSGPLTKLTMGIDTNKFRIIDKKVIREKLNLPDNRKIILSVTRLNDHKQVDRAIEVLNRINLDFIFLIVGHGTSQYEEYLHEKARPLLNKEKIRFEGYKRDDELLEYLNAADLFVQVSKSEGSSVAVMEAMACGIPIFCTDTGNTAEVLKEYNAGIVVGIKNYKEWEGKLIDYLSGTPIKVLNLGVVRKHYEWKNIADKFIEIYNGN